MPQLSTRRVFLHSSLAMSVAVMTSSCGTILYSERMGQPRGSLRDVDWTVAGMNAIGLVFFFVPGVIAFAIDFGNGTLFYPPDQRYGMTEPQNLKQVQLEVNPSLATVEQTISHETGKQVNLSQGNFLSRKMSSIKEFWPFEREIADIAETA